MSTTEVKELVEKGIVALKAGDREEARFWLAEAIQQDSRNERAWVYLAAVLPRQQAIAALERVLVLNPQNAKAQKGLTILLNQAIQPAQQINTPTEAAAQPTTALPRTTVQEADRPTRSLPRPAIISRSDRRPGRRPDKTQTTTANPIVTPVASEEIKTAPVSPAPAFSDHNPGFTDYVPSFTDRIPDFDEQPTRPYQPPLVFHVSSAPGGTGVEGEAEQTIFDRGFHTLDTDREDDETDIHPHAEPIEEGPALEPPLYEEPLEFADRVRKILNMPAPPVIRQPRRLSPLSTFLLVLLPVLVVGAIIFFVFLSPGNPKPVQTPVGLTVTSPAALSNVSGNAFPDSASGISPDTATAEASPEPVLTPTPALPTATPAPTALPTPTIPPVIKMEVAQGERAVLRGFALTFSGYENRSNNFSFAGAGTPKNGTHFEGVMVSLENTGPKLVPVTVDEFQGLDGQNNYLKPVGGGRVPSMDISRLQMGEQRMAWLTFEVADGTTLRRVTFSPTSDPDLNNTVSVNLTLAAVTPAPVVKPTAVPTTAPKPTATPGPTSTMVVAGTPGANNSLTPGPTEIMVSPSPQASAQPTMPPAPTATPLPTRLPAQNGQMNQRMVIGNFAVTVTNFQGSPSIKPPPLILPQFYHYETVKITVENIGDSDSDVSDFLGSYPFFLRDGDDRIFSVGPESLDANATDRFNPQTFAPTVIGAGKKSVTGVVYFLVKDMAPPGRTFIFYASNNLDSPRIEVPLK